MESNSGSKNNLLAFSIIAAAFVVGGSLIYSSSFRQSEPNSMAKVGPDDSSPTASNNNPTIDDDVILGDPNAPVTIVEFGDYQCPYCKRFFDDVEGRIREEYIKTGKVKMVYRDFPLEQIHPFALPAALAAECARDEEKYWAYHDALFERQAKLQTLDFAALAGELGLDRAVFKKCVDGKKYEGEVRKDYNDGVAAGVTGTPTSFLNGRIMPGALPYETFKAAIDTALNQ